MNGDLGELYKLLWPPAWEARAADEGWVLRCVGLDTADAVELDYLEDRPTSSPDSRRTYRDLIVWIIIGAYVAGDPMYRTAWEFEYASNKALYTDGRIPGDPGPRITGLGSAA